MEQQIAKLIMSFVLDGHKLFFLTSENTAYISDRRWCVRNQDYSLKISNFKLINKNKPSQVGKNCIRISDMCEHYNINFNHNKCHFRMISWLQINVLFPKELYEMSVIKNWAVHKHCWSGEEII